MKWWISLRQVLGWWLQELRDIVAAVIGRVAPQWVTRIFVRVERNQATVSISRGKQQQVVCTAALSLDGTPAPDLEPAAMPWKPGTRAVFALATDLVLTRRLVLPDSVERDLDRVIALQLERESPLPPDQIYIDRFIVTRQRQRRQIGVEVSIVHRARVERLGEIAKKWRVHAVRVGVLESSGQVRGNFLLTQAKVGRSRVTRLDRSLMALGAIMAAALLLLIAGQWIFERFEVGKESSHTSAKAHEVDRLLRRISTEAAPAEGLVNLMSQPDALDVLVALSEQVPSDSWVYDLDVTAQLPEAPQIKLSGFTPVATTFVDQLGKSGHFERVQIVSAMSAGLGSGRDRLQITARWGPATHNKGPASGPDFRPGT